MSQLITIETFIHAPIEKVWQYFTEPNHITKWNYASEDLHTPYATNNLIEGGSFSWRMEAKDGSSGFDFAGTYQTIKENELIEYTIADGRKVQISFTANGAETHVVETFEAEAINPVDLQQKGWQAILNNFKKYTEKY